MTGGAGRWARRATRLDFIDGLGIAIGTRSVAMVHLVKRLATVSLDAHRTVPLPPREQTKERSAALSAAVRQFVEEKNYATDRVFVTLPRGSALLARLSLPLAAKGDLAQVVEFELDRLIPLARDEVYHDYLTRETAQKLEVLVVSVPRRIAAPELEALEAGGVRPRSVVITPVSVLDFVRFAPQGDESVVVLIEDGGSVEVDHVAGDHLISSHVVKPGELSTDAALTSLVGREVSLRPGSGEVPVFAFSSDDVAGTASSSALPADLVARGRDLLRKLEGALTVPAGFLDNASPALVPAIGAGLAAVREGSADLNLLPAEERRAVEEGAPVVTFFLAAVLVVVTLVWLISAVVKDHRIRNALHEELAELEPQVRTIHTNSREADGLREKLNVLTQDTGVRNSIFLEELTNIIPADAYLTTFRLRNGRVELEGFAASASDLVPLLEKSNLFEQAQFTSPVTKVQNNQERFSLTAELSK